MIEGHGGNIFALAARLGCDPNHILDFSSNINPLGTMPQLLPLLQENMASIVALPEVDNRRLVDLFSQRHDLCTNQVLTGGGTTQFIHALPLALKIRKALIVAPTYSDYADACSFHHVPFDHYFTRMENNFCPDLIRLAKVIKRYDTVYLCNPNNPTGVLAETDHLYKLCSSHPGTRFLIDESYLPFVPNAHGHSLLKCNLPNVVVLHSLSKIFGIPGLRIGFMKAHKTIIDQMRPYLLPWCVNTLAQAAAEYVLTNDIVSDKFIRQTCTYLATERDALIRRLEDNTGLRCYPSTTSFILIRLPDRVKSDTVCRFLADRKILIRNCNNFSGIDNHHIRIALKTTDANRLVTDALTLFWASSQTSDSRC